MCWVLCTVRWESAPGQGLLWAGAQGAWEGAVGEWELHREGPSLPGQGAETERSGGGRGSKMLEPGPGLGRSRSRGRGWFWLGNQQQQVELRWADQLLS